MDAAASLLGCSEALRWRLMVNLKLVTLLLLPLAGLSDWRSLPEKRTLLPQEGGLGWKCATWTPCWVGKETPPLRSFDGARTHSEPIQPLFSFSELYLRAFIPPSLRLLPLSRRPTQTDVRPSGFLTGSCKPPVCTRLLSYGGVTVMAVQAPYTCKCWQADTL